MIESRRGKMVVTKSGSGSSTFRATLPATWIRKMGLGEEDRNLKFQFDGKSITIINNKEEVEMLEKLLGIAKVEIEKEMERVGFIDNSDLVDRFLDNLAEELAKKEILKGSDDIELYYEMETEIKELEEELLCEIENYMKKNYKKESNVTNGGDYIGCYYKDREGLMKFKRS